MTCVFALISLRGRWHITVYDEEGQNRPSFPFIFSDSIHVSRAHLWFVLKISFHCRKKRRDLSVIAMKDQTNRLVYLLELTCILLRQHWSVNDQLKCCHPVFLILCSLACKQKTPFRGLNGDSVQPVVSLDVGRKSRKYTVAVSLAADEHFSSGEGILQQSGV